MMCGVAGGIIYFLRYDIDQDLLDNVSNFLKEIVDSNLRVTHGLFYLLHAIIVSKESGYSRYIQHTYDYVRQALRTPQDEECVKFACGLVVDMSLAMGSDFSQFTDTFIRDLIDLINNPEMNHDVKSQALIALGDICLAVEGHYVPFLEESMAIISQALQATIQSPQIFSSLEALHGLRDAVFEAVISIFQGLQNIDNSTVRGLL